MDVIGVRQGNALIGFNYPTCKSSNSCSQYRTEGNQSHSHPNKNVSNGGIGHAHRLKDRNVSLLAVDERK